MSVAVEMLDRGRVERRRTLKVLVGLVTLPEQQLRELRPDLPSQAGNQRPLRSLLTQIQSILTCR